MNLDAVLAACARLPDIGITHRRTGISTVGWIPGIERLAGEAAPLRLALSLHAPEDALRSQIMPVNERYPLADVIAACRRHYERKRRRVFVEYVMLAGVNDRVEQARALADLLDPRAFKVNLIPFNPTGSSYRGSSPARDRGVPCRARTRRPGGHDPPHARTRHRRGVRPAGRRILHGMNAAGELQGQVALVTGGGRGIGRLIARELADAGMRVAVAARSADQVEETAREIGGLAVTADVSKPGGRRGDDRDRRARARADRPARQQCRRFGLEAHRHGSRIRRTGGACSRSTCSAPTSAPAPCCPA